MEGCVDLRALLVDELEVSVEQVQVVASCRVYGELECSRLNTEHVDKCHSPDPP